MSDGNPNSPTESDSEGSYNGDIKSSPSPDDEDQLLPELRCAHIKFGGESLKSVKSTSSAWLF